MRRERIGISVVGDAATIPVEAPLLITLFGGLTITRDGAAPVTRFPTQKTAALLAYLALQPSRAHGREFLTDLIWPDSSPEAGNRSFRVALTALRKLLEPSGVPMGSALIADRSTVRLNVPVGVQTDIALFEAATASQEADRLDQAIALYRGPLLPGFSDDWVVRERERLAGLYRGLLLRRAQIAEQSGGLTTALAYARRAVTLEESPEAAPGRIVSEEAHMTVIRLLTQTGHPEEARQQYDTLARRLSDLYDEAPSPEARAQLARLTLEPGDDPPSVPRRPPVSPNLPPLDNDPPRSPKAEVHLPLLPTRFFGRGYELDRIVEALLSGERLVTLTGPGGSGKTRLAIEAARRSAPAFSVYFVSLANLAGNGPVLTAISDALGLERLPGPRQVRERLFAALREKVEANGALLLILDNFEDLVEAGAPIVSELLGAVDGLHLLVTSRRRLQIPGEREVPVTPLPVPMQPAAPERLLEWASVQLFVDRAQAVRPDFQITARNAEAIARLCGRLDGIPLALELTAAWAGVLTPVQMLERVEAQLLDEAGPPMAYHRARRAERHRTLRAAIDSSFALLSTDLKDAFARLSIFRGGWTLPAAERILEGIAGSTADLLTRLRERSLITVTVADEEDSIRFQMLGVLREFADEQLQEPERSLCAEAHTAFFIEFAAAENGIMARASFEQRSALMRIDTEYANLSAVMERLSANSEEYEREGLRLSAALGWYWMKRGYAQAGVDFSRPFLEKGMPEGSSAERRRTRIIALIRTAELAEVLHDYSEVSVWMTEALLACEGRSELWEQEAGVHSVLGMLAMAQGDYPAARARFESALEIHRQNGSEANASGVRNNLGLVCWYEGDYDAATSCFEVCLSQDKAVGDRAGEAYELFNLGMVACSRGDLERARSLMEASLEIRRDLNDRYGLANVLGNLGQILLLQGKTIEAEEALRESLAIARSGNDRQQAAYALGILGVLATQQKRFAEAGRLLGECLSDFVSLGDRFQSAQALDACASLAAAIAAEKAAEHKERRGTSAEIAAYRRAVRLWSAADRLREEIGAQGSEEDRQERESAIAAARTALGPKVFEREITQGRAMPLEDIAAEVQRPF